MSWSDMMYCDRKKYDFIFSIQLFKCRRRRWRWWWRRQSWGRIGDEVCISETPSGWRCSVAAKSIRGLRLHGFSRLVLHPILQIHHSDYFCCTASFLYYSVILLCSAFLELFERLVFCLLLHHLTALSFFWLSFLLQHYRRGLYSVVSFLYSSHGISRIRTCEVIILVPIPTHIEGCTLCKLYQDITRPLIICWNAYISLSVHPSCSCLEE